MSQSDYDRQRNMQPERYAARRAYQRTPAGKEAMQRSRQKWLAKNPEKRKAQIIVGNAVRDGHLKKKPCWCGSQKVQAHHDDYSKPLDVVWACAKHHRELDLARR